MKVAADARSTTMIKIANGIVVVPAVISLGVAIRHGLQQGQDFQWSGTHLLLEGIDPYLQFLRKDPGHLFLFSQAPNYLHELYVLLLPLGLLRFETARAVFLLINLILTVSCVVLLGRIYQLDRARTLLLGLILAISVPFRVLIGNGQHAMLELLFLLLILVAVPPRGLWLGLSYFKYSFSPVFFFYYVFQCRWRLLLWSVVAPVAGVLVFWFFLRGNVIHLTEEPFLVSRPGGGGVANGLGDVGALVTAFAISIKPGLALLAGSVASIVGSILVAWFVARRRSTDAAAFAALIPASLLLLVHLTYDYVFLLLPLAATLGLSREASRRRIISFGSIALLWFLIPSTILAPHLPALVTQFIVCLLLLLIISCHLPSTHAALQVTAHD